MPTFRKKPVEVEAVQFLELHGDKPRFSTNPPQWLKDAAREIVLDGAVLRPVFDFAFGKLTIVTLEGVLTVTEGDWIIRGVKGELYPCKPDIFAATYEPLDDTETFAAIKERARS